MIKAFFRDAGYREDEGPDLTPLLDVIFILLLFFIIASAFAVRGMDVELPPAQTSRPLSGKILELRLASDGSLSCEGVALKPADLGLFLRNSAARNGAGLPDRRQLVLRTAPDAPVEALVRIVDAVRKLGGERLVIATGKPGSEPAGQGTQERP